ncbi:hypothetical protein [Negativicoccus succinicivorans]
MEKNTSQKIFITSSRAYRQPAPAHGKIKRTRSVSRPRSPEKASAARTEKEKSDFTYCKKMNNCADQILRVQRQINKKKIK